MNAGVLKAAAYCSQEISGDGAYFHPEHKANEGLSKVGYLGTSGGKPVVLVEAKSPTVMKVMSESLPPHGITLKWLAGGALIPRIFQKVGTCVFKHEPNFDDSRNSIGRSLSGSEENGVALPHKPQSLDHLPSGQRP